MAIQAITSFKATPQKSTNKVNQTQGQSTGVSFGNAPNMAVSATKKVAGGLTLAALLTAAAVFFTGCGSSATGADPEEVIASSSSEEIVPESSSSEEVVTPASSSSKEDSSSSSVKSSSSEATSSSSSVKSSSSEATSSSSAASSSSEVQYTAAIEETTNTINNHLAILGLVPTASVSAKKVAVVATTDLTAIADAELAVPTGTMTYLYISPIDKTTNELSLQSANSDGTLTYSDKRTRTTTGAQYLDGVKIKGQNDTTYATTTTSEGDVIHEAFFPGTNIYGKKGIVRYDLDDNYVAYVITKNDSGGYDLTDDDNTFATIDLSTVLKK